jgi:hypothetical protein
MTKKKLNPTIIVATLIFSALSSTFLLAEEATVLERIRKVENPELAKLIRIAINNLPEQKLHGHTTDRQKNYEIAIAKSKAIRIVTEKYAQIKLLDIQIEQIENRISATGSTDSIKAELVIAKASLESERIMHIAGLREALNLVPWAPLAPKEVHELNTWLHLETLDDNTVRVLKFKKTYSKYFSQNSSDNVSLKTPEETLKYFDDIVKTGSALPIRITFGTSEKGEVATNDIQDKIQMLIYGAGVEYETDFSKAKRTLEGTVIKVSNHNPNQVIEMSNPSRGYTVDQYLRKVKRMVQSPDSLPLEIKVRPYREELKSDYEKLITGLHETINKLEIQDYVTIKLPEE